MTGPAQETTIGRVYEPTQQGEGFRVLVDRLWPRGRTTASAALDL